MTPREVVAQVLHEETGTQHYATTEAGYDGDPLEIQQCIGGPDDHLEDADAVIAALEDLGYRLARTTATPPTDT